MNYLPIVLSLVSGLPDAWFTEPILPPDVAGNEVRRWVDSQLRDYAHLDATWAGDGLMAIFEQPEAAVWFGRTLLEGLPRLNRVLNTTWPLSA